MMQDAYWQGVNASHAGDQGLIPGPDSAIYQLLKQVMTALFDKI